MGVCKGLVLALYYIIESFAIKSFVIKNVEKCQAVLLLSSLWHCESYGIVNQGIIFLSKYFELYSLYFLADS